MIPSTVEIIEDEQQTVAAPSLTYYINETTMRIQGTVDGEASIVQAIRKILDTDRYAYEIYDWYYGHDLVLLVGKPIAYIEAEAPRIIKEALEQDDRVISVSDVKVSKYSVDSLTITATVKTILGDLAVEVEV